MPRLVRTVVGAAGPGPVCPTAMALAVFLLFLSSVSAQTIYDIVSRRFISTSLKCHSNKHCLSALYSGKRHGTATSCSQGFIFLDLIQLLFCSMFLDRVQNTAIKFGKPGPIGVADIVVDDSVVYQQMVCHVFVLLSA